MNPVWFLGLGFACILTAFQTSSFFQGKLLDDLGYHSLGFVSLAVLYFFFAVLSFFAPWVISRIGMSEASYIARNVGPLRVSSLCYSCIPGPRGALIAGAACYTTFLASMIYVSPALFMTGSAINGVGAALIWTAEVSQRGRAGGIVGARRELGL